LKAFLENYEKEKFVVAGRELGKSASGVKKRVKELKLVS
jgi:hypothetical protein